MLPSADDEKRLLGLMRFLLGRSVASRDGSFRTQLANGATTATLLSTAAANLIIMVCSGLKLYLDPPEETEKASQVAFLMTVSVANAMKGFSMVQQRARLQQVVAGLLAMRRAVCDGSGARHRYACSATLIGNIWMVMSVILGIVWGVDPVFNQPPQLNGTSPDPVLPLPIWLPLDASVPLTYWLMFALEAVVCGWTIFFVMIVDLLYVTLILNFAAELHVLNHNIQITCNAVDVTAHPKRKIGVSRHAGVSLYKGHNDDTAAIPNFSLAHFTAANPLMPAYIPDHFRVELSEDYDTYRLLVKSIQHHQLIVKCVNEFGKATGLPVLMVVSINVVNLCSNIISLAVLVEEDPHASAIAKSLIFTIALGSQTALYCLPGQMIIDQSERLAHSAFCCRWPDAGVRFKRSLLVFMACAGRPLRLRVGKLVTLSRETFQELLKLSYQLFNLVYQLQSS
uniref:Odorant receptor n=1 Tax=Locusta migratoria TaxID=7004 RepID=A0A0M4J319_LOCMI|nr:odorant receptor 110 [Locusta migratoria]